MQKNMNVDGFLATDQEIVIGLVRTWMPNFFIYKDISVWIKLNGWFSLI